MIKNEKRKLYGKKDQVTKHCAFILRNTSMALDSLPSVSVCFLQSQPTVCWFEGDCSPWADVCEHLVPRLVALFGLGGVALWEDLCRGRLAFRV